MRASRGDDDGLTDEQRRLIVLLDIALISTHGGEAESALKHARELAHHTGIRVAEFREIARQRFQVLDKAKALQAERDAALNEVERLKRPDVGGTAPNGLAQALWQNASTVSSVARAASWALQHGRVMRWTPKEADFLTDITRRQKQPPDQGSA